MEGKNNKKKENYLHVRKMKEKIRGK